jgi:hypothetical protein
MSTSTLLAQTLPECNIEALFQFPPQYPKTLCQRFQEQQIQPAPIILGVPGWQTDADVFAQTGSSVLTNKTVFVQGNFNVLSNFEFNNCWVIISPGVKIIVNGGTTTQPLLTIDQSRLFCCTGLWAGIDLEKNARVNTQNNSEIEDATTAVIADGEANTLSLNNTTFNRNRVGVQLGKTTSAVGTSITMVGFSGNKFTCTSPLNTTVSEITFAGILVQRTTGTTTLSGNSEFAKIHHGIYVGIHLQNVKLDQTILNVSFCKFDQIIKKGIFADPKIVLNVFGSTFINNGTHSIDILRSSHLQVLFSTFTYDDDVISNGNNFYYGIRFNPTGPDVIFDNQYIQNNDFYVTFLNGAKFERIHCISMYGDLDGVSGDLAIDYNEFHMKFRMGTGISGETRAISLTGGTHIVGENSIIDNDFEFENFSSPNVTSYAINVTNGDYNNLTIADNRFHHTYNTSLTLGEIGIRLNGSTGSGNLVSLNRFDELPTGPSRAYAYGIYSVDFDNTNYEYNLLRECNTGFFFNGLSENSQMICNDIIGGNTLLQLFGAVIGDQGEIDILGNIIKTNGNEWDNVEAPTYNALCIPTNLADFSKFYVTGNQSFSNPYFPIQIDPNSGWFTGGGPDPECSMGLTQNSLERSVVTGELAIALNNPADAWEAERYLLNRLNVEAGLLNSWSGFQIFKNAKNGTPMAQLSAVQKMIDDAFVPSPSLAAQVAQKRAETIPLLEQAKQLDDQIINGETASLLAQRVQLQANLAVKLGDAAALDSTYRLETATKLQAAKTANNAISVTALYEVNTKAVNGLLIDLVLYDTLSEMQANNLKAIAAQCPRTGGMAVYKARGILPDCEMENISEAPCYPSEERGLIGASGNSDQAFQIAPNPNNGSFMLRANEFLGSKVSIYDALGSLVLEHHVNEKTPVLDIKQDLCSGIYFCRILDKAGKSQVIPFVVLQ